MSNKLAVGDFVAYLTGPHDAAKSAIHYTVVQLMPAERGEYQYSVRRDKAGELRRVREAQPAPLAKRPVRLRHRIAAGATH